MQHIFCSHLQFVQRTDALASVLACNLNDLPEKIGISQRSMYAYRAGRNPVTAKALRKLEVLERASGVGTIEGGNAESSGDAEDQGGADAVFLRDDVAQYRVREKAGGEASDGRRPPLHDEAVAAAFAKIREGLDLLEALMKSPKP